MKRLILLAVLLAGGLSGIRAQEHSGEFRHARLKNGLTYYIRQTSREQRISISCRMWAP